MKPPARAFALLLLGAVAGALLSRALWPGEGGSRAGAAGPVPPAEEPSHAAGLAPIDEGKGPCVVPPPLALPPVAARGEAVVPPFEAGTAILRIGDAYVFGEDHARAPGKAEDADIVCQDIREGASLACPHGAVAADLPLAAVGVPARPADAAVLLVDAPADLPERNASLLPRPSERLSGLALVRSAAGKTYKTWLVEERGDPNALARLVKIGYAEVPVAAGGGVLRVPTTAPLGTAANATQGEIRRLAQVGHSIPGDSFAGQVSGAYERPSELPEELVTQKEAYLLLDKPLRTKVTIGGRGALYASAGIDREGKVVLASYSALAVKGDLGGTVDVQSYAYVHVSGDVTGELDARSYATVVIDGDIRGTVKVRSYVTLLLRGRIYGALDVAGSCWSTFWFQGFRSQSEIAAMPGSLGQITLHVETSDVPAGEVKPAPGTWRQVIVGDPAWKKIAR